MENNIDIKKDDELKSLELDKKVIENLAKNLIKQHNGLVELLSTRFAQLEFLYSNLEKFKLNEIISYSELDFIIEKAHGLSVNIVDVKTGLDKLESLAGSYKIKVLDIVKAREAFVKSKEMLSIINNIDFKLTSDIGASLEFLSVLLLSELRNSESFVDVYRDTIVLGLELGLNREEDIYKILAKDHIKILQELKDEQERAV